MLGDVSVLESVRSLLLRWCSGVERPCGSELLDCALVEVDVVVGRLVALLTQNPVDVSRSAPVYFVLLGDVARVAWQVLLPVLDVSHGSDIYLFLI